MRLILYIGSLLFALFSAQISGAQGLSTTNDSAQAAQAAQKNKVVVLPVIYYTPETRLAFGATGFYFFRFAADSAKSRPSTLQMLTAYTQNKQILLSGQFNIFAQREKYWLTGQVAFYRYPYVFNGVGNDRPAGYEEEYTAQFPRLRLRALQRIAPSLYGGIRVRFQHNNIVATADSAFTDAGNVGALLGTDAIPGGKGGTSSGLGLALNFDTRDQVFYPTKGIFIQVSNVHQSASFLSDFSFDTYLVDARKYISIKQKHIFALQAFGEWNYGNTPFHRMAQMGGPSKMRGYLQGAYRDKKQLIFQTEYRSPFWRSMGIAVFTGFGGIADDSQDFTLPEMRWTYGAGWRWRIEPKEKINLRFDVGLTEDGNSQFYFTFGEAF